MKYRLSFVIISIAVSFVKSDAQDWFPLNSGTSTTLTSINFPSTSSGWASGWNGIIIFTSNGGANWVSQNSGTSALLNSIRFVNNSTGWSVGENGMILYTSNGGANWVIQSSTTSQILYCVFFINSSTGWISGYSGTILKTTNAGTNWIIQNSSVFSYLRAICFTDLNTGIATGYNGEIIRTSNGGNNWYEISYSQTSTLYGVFFINSSYGWAGGLGGQRTTDGGNSWNLMSGYGTLGIYFTSINTGWQVGFQGVQYSTNSGLSWNIYNLGSSGWLYSVYFSSQSVGYICGDYGQIFETTDGGGLLTGIEPIKKNIPEKFYLYQNYPNPFNPSTKIKFDIPNVSPPFSGHHLGQGGQVGLTTLKIYDILGREIAILINERLSSGTYEVEWPAPTGNASNYPSGIYYYKFIAGNFSETKKMLMIK